MFQGTIARVAWLVMAVVIVVGVALGFGDVTDMGDVVLGGGLLIVLALLMTVDPASIKELTAGPGGLSLKREVATAEAAAATVPREETEAAVEPAAHTGDRLTDLQLLLEAKLSYIAGFMDVESSLVNIGSLHHDGYLTDDEATTARRILYMTEDELGSAPKREQDAFLAAAEELVGGIRAGVLAGSVRKKLESAGWMWRSAGGKRDIHAERDGRAALVVPLFVTSSDSDLLDKVLNRVSRVDEAERRIIVIPNHSDSPTTSPGDDPAVVKVDALTDALEVTISGRARS